MSAAARPSPAREIAPGGPADGAAAARGGAGGIRVGFLTYDLQPFTEDCLYRIAEAIRPMRLTAYPVMHHPHQARARVPARASAERGRYWAVDVAGSTPEGFASNVNWGAAAACARESDVVVLFGLQGGTALVAALLATLRGRPIVYANQRLPVAWEVRRPR